MKKPIIPNFKSIDHIEDEYWWAMSDAGMSFPVPLRKADLSKPFIYQRKFGVFYVDPSKHQLSLSLLLAWEFGEENYLDIEAKEFSGFQGSDIWAFADYFLSNYIGTAYKSSVSKNSVIAGKRSNLNSMEQDYFENIKYLLKK